MAGGSDGSTARILVVLFTSATLGLVGFMLRETLISRDFRAAGPRFSNEQAAELERRLELRLDVCDEGRAIQALRLEHLASDLEEIREESKRLQVQIDRLEGHSPRGYTEDQGRLELPPAPELEGGDTVGRVTNPGYAQGKGG